MNKYIVYHEEHTNSGTFYFLWGDWFVKNTSKMYTRKPTQKAIKTFAEKYGFSDHAEAYKAYKHCIESYNNPASTATEHVITLMTFITL